MNNTEPHFLHTATRSVCKESYTQQTPKADLRDLIHKKLYTVDDNLLIGIDANEAYNKRQNSSIFDMLSSLDLHDALLHLNEADRTCTILSCSLITHYIFVSQSLLPH